MELAAFLNQHIDVDFIFGCEFQFHEEVFLFEGIHLCSFIDSQDLDGFLINADGLKEIAEVCLVNFCAVRFASDRHLAYEPLFKPNFVEVSEILPPDLFDVKFFHPFFSLRS